MGVLADYRPDGFARAEVAVLVSVVASMGLEIVAGRVVAPEFGSSIFTWGSIIGVFLAALSLGYWRGGRRAAEAASYRQLSLLLFGAAAYVGLLFLAGDLLLRSAARVPLPARFAPLFPVTLLFGPPVYLLGVVSPYAAELSEKEGVGEASGHVYALGTVGSIVGAFGTTFLLVPALDIRSMWLLFGGLLVFGAVRARIDGLRGDGLAVAAVVLVVVGAVAAVPTAAIGDEDVVYETQTPYQELRVADDDGVRTLYLDGQPHSAMDLDRPNRHVFDYTRYFHLPLLLTGDVDRVLFVGGGGFTGPKIFADRYDVTVDVVEIDPEVVDVAEQYFRLEEDEDLNVHVEDGRRFLRTTDREYDVIVLDAYRKDKVPFHLTTVEFMELTSERLDEDGVLLANLIAAPSGAGSQFYRAQYRTIDRVYPQVYSFPTSQGSHVQNVELIATKRDVVVTEAELRERNERREVGYDLDHEISFYTRDVAVGDAPVLRDDRAPVDRLLDPMAGKRYVVQRTGENGTPTDDSRPSLDPRFRAEGPRRAP